MPFRTAVAEATEVGATAGAAGGGSLCDLCRASDVGKGTLYRYFRSKRELYLAVMFGGIDRLRGEIEAVTRAAAPPVCKLERIVCCTLGLFWDRRRFFALIHQNEHKPDRDVREWFRQRQRLVRLVQETVDEDVAVGGNED